MCPSSNVSRQFSAQAQSTCTRSKPQTKRNLRRKLQDSRASTSSHIHIHIKNMSICANYEDCFHGAILHARLLYNLYELVNSQMPSVLPFVPFEVIRSFCGAHKPAKTQKNNSNPLAAGRARRKTLIRHSISYLVAFVLDVERRGEPWAFTHEIDKQHTL